MPSMDSWRLLKLPKGNEAEAAQRSETIQTSYMKAVDIPLTIAKNCLQILQLADQIKRQTGNKNCHK